MASNVLLYNPDQKNKADIIQEFVIRNQEFDSIWKTLKTSDIKHPPQHFLVQGQRGMGKTTLLLRLKYAIEDDPELSEWLLPVKFSEEQYHIAHLEDLWESVAEMLETNYDGFENLPEQIGKWEKEKDFEERASEAVVKALKTNKKRVLVMIDNLGDLFEKFGDLETHRLRQVLLSNPEIQLLGASAYVLEHTFEYDKAFYEFFQIVQLKPITKENSIALMRVLGEKFAKEDDVENFLKTQSAKMEVLRRFTGGVPRTMALLFGIFMDQQSGSTFESLQLLLDEVNSLYKHRMDELKPQQQKIMDTLAKAWEPISTKQILEQSKLYRSDVKSNQISAQLKLMEDNQLVESVEGPGKNKTYRIRERFFNIWYLMRYGKKYHKEEVLWLVRFLEDWCDVTELSQQVKFQIEAMGNEGYSPKAAYFKAMALANVVGIKPDLKLKLLESTEWFLQNFPDDKRGMDALNKTKRIELDKMANIIVAIINKGIPLPETYKVAEMTIDSFNYLIAKSLDSMPQDLNTLQLIKPLILIGHKNGIISCTNMLAMITAAINMDQTESLLKNSSSKEDLTGNLALGAFYFHQEKNSVKAIEILQKNIEREDNRAYFILGEIEQYENRNFELAAKYYIKAGEAGIKEAYLTAAQLLTFVLNDFAKAESILIKMVAQEVWEALTPLGRLYLVKNDYENAVKFLAMAIDKGFKEARLALLLTLSLFGVSKVLFELAEEILNDNSAKSPESSASFVISTLLNLGQFHFLYNQFKKPELELMKYARPYWYVLMWFMKKEYPGEYEKVGSELKETVDEIIQSIEADQRANEGKL